MKRGFRDPRVARERAMSSEAARETGGRPSGPEYCRVCSRAREGRPPERICTVLGICPGCGKYPPRDPCVMRIVRTPPLGRAELAFSAMLILCGRGCEHDMVGLELVVQLLGAVSWGAQGPTIQSLEEPGGGRAVAIGWTPLVESLVCRAGAAEGADMETVLGRLAAAGVPVGRLASEVMSGRLASEVMRGELVTRLSSSELTYQSRRHGGAMISWGNRDDARRLRDRYAADIPGVEAELLRLKQVGSGFAAGLERCLALAEGARAACNTALAAFEWSWLRRAWAGAVARARPSAPRAVEP